MIDEGSGGGGANVMQWAAALAAVLVTVSGAFIYVAPLVSSRPPTPATLDRSAVDQEEKVPARLWQDPFKAVVDYGDYVLRTKADENARQSIAGGAWHVTVEGSPGSAPKPAKAPDAESQVNASLKQLLAGDRQDLLVLPVMVPNAPEGELAEQRLRVRVAVVEGLMASGYEPDPDAKHIGAIPLDWPYRRFAPGPSVLKELTDSLQKGSSENVSVKLPYERWRSMPSRPAGNHWQKPAFDRVLVLWLAEEEFSDVPLARLALLINQGSAGRSPSSQTSSSSLPVQMRVLGPRSSGTLNSMIVESRTPDPNVKAALGNTTLYAATPTAEDAILLSGDSDETKDPSNPLPRTVQARIGKLVRCVRTTLTDRAMAASLADELQRRQIGSNDQIAVISEWDTFYGRALGSTFIAAVSRNSAVSADELVKNPGKVPSNFHPFHYLSGIDGAVAQEATQEKKNDSPSAAPAEFRRGSPKYESPPEQPEGLNQADYLRRLADQLGTLDDSLQRQKGKRLSAVAILGTDLYDKLLILRAVRDRLPNVIFLTTGLDSRYALPSEWVAAHNLIIAAPFGLRLHEFYQQGNPPFRDSDQTAVYHGTLSAVWDGNWGRMGGDKDKPIYMANSLGAPRLFEIGRGGPVDLTVEDDGNNTENRQTDAKVGQPQSQRSGGMPDAGSKPPTVHPVRDDVLGVPERWKLWTGCMVVVLALAAAMVALAPRPLVRPLWLVGAISVGLVLILCLCAIADGQEGEPAVWLGRVNVWPGEFIRLFEVIVSCFLLVSSFIAVRKTDQAVEAMFKLKPLVATSWTEWFRHPYKKISESFQNLYHLFEECEDCKDRTVGEIAPWDIPYLKSKIDVQDLWDQYRGLASLMPRMARLLTLGVLLLALAVALWWLLPSPPTPTRGDWAYWVNGTLQILMVITGIALTVFVFDGAILNAGLISSLVRPDGYPYYPDEAFDQWPWAKFGGDRYDLTEVLAVSLIVRRTQVASAAVYYPFIIFLLVLLGRVPLFADWRWSSWIVIFVGVCLLLTLGAAVVLKRAAELARRTSIGKIRLRAARYSNFGKPDQKAAMEQLAGYVEKENRGAFSRVLPTMIFFIVTLLGWGVIDYFGRYISP